MTYSRELTGDYGQNGGSADHSDEEGELQPLAVASDTMRLKKNKKKSNYYFTINLFCRLAIHFGTSAAMNSGKEAHFDAGHCTHRSRKAVTMYMVEYSMVWYSMVEYSMVWYSMV